jgi:acetyltransferase
MFVTAGIATANRWRKPLEPFFKPGSVAVIGATETVRAPGRTVLENLSAFPGLVYPVNPRHAMVLGRTCYPSIADVPGTPDLAVIVTPAATVPRIVGECAAAGVPAAIIISAGFKEVGPHGLEMEREIAAARGSMRIVGPNCLGIIAPYARLNASFAAGAARPGNIAFLSQSGALCTAILDWSLREMVGFSAFVSTGSMLDVGWGDLIGYLGDDPHTQAILLYMESIGDARSFLSVAREVALEKPIIVLKAGRTAQAAQAAASHTGALTGQDAVLDAAFRRCGVLRVDRISELFYMAETLARQPRPAGRRLAIVTNAGGPAVLATDSLIAEGGNLARAFR